MRTFVINDAIYSNSGEPVLDDDAWPDDYEDADLDDENDDEPVMSDDYLPLPEPATETNVADDGLLRHSIDDLLVPPRIDFGQIAHPSVAGETGDDDDGDMLMPPPSFLGRS